MEIVAQAKTIAVMKSAKATSAGRVPALGVDEQRVNVIIDPERLPPMIGDGFRVEVSIVVWSTSDAVVAPRSALLQAGERRAADEWTAFVIRDSRVERRSVKVGHVGGVSAEVLSGIAPGEAVVAFPSERVAPGIRVKVRRA